MTFDDSTVAETREITYGPAATGRYHASCEDGKGR